MSRTEWVVHHYLDDEVTEQEDVFDTEAEAQACVQQAYGYSSGVFKRIDHRPNYAMDALGMFAERLQDMTDAVPPDDAGSVIRSVAQALTEAIMLARKDAGE